MASFQDDKSLWTMKNGEKIAVKDMTISHVRNVLKMLILRYSKILITQYGARYASGINVENFSEEEARDLLNEICADIAYLKRMVAERCFGPIVWKDLVENGIIKFY
jgi:hypothetical protein